MCFSRKETAHSHWVIRGYLQRLKGYYRDSARTMTQTLSLLRGLESEGRRSPERSCDAEQRRGKDQCGEALQGGSQEQSPQTSHSSPPLTFCWCLPSDLESREPSGAQSPRKGEWIWKGRREL